MDQSLTIALQNYSGSETMGLVFLIMSTLFTLVWRDLRSDHFKWLALGCLSASIAWGTTRWQGVGRPMVDWGWWWAQPFFIGTLLYFAIGMHAYLPVSALWRKRANLLVVVPSVAYLLIVTLLLLMGVNIQRTWAVTSLVPALLTGSVSAFASERIEPQRGHLFLGLALLTIPFITVGSALFAAPSTAVRTWTAIPLMTTTITVLAVSLLREHAKLTREVMLRQRAERQIIIANRDLETRVLERTAMLQEVIGDLEKFNVNVSHDLRAPLGGISMLAYMAEHSIKQGDSDSAQGYVGEISEQVQHSFQTIDTLLDMARVIEKGGSVQRLDLEVFVADLIKQVLPLHEPVSAWRSTPTFVLQDLGGVTADPSLMRIIFTNLIGNALKFNARQKQLTVRVGRFYEEDGQLGLFVNDNGVGLEPKAIDISLDRAPRSETGTSVEGGGLGLGLGIVRHAVQRMGGRLWVESQPGQGATFFFTFDSATV